MVPQQGWPTHIRVQQEGTQSRCLQAQAPWKKWPLGGAAGTGPSAELGLGAEQPDPKAPVVARELQAASAQAGLAAGSGPELWAPAPPSALRPAPLVPGPRHLDRTWSCLWLALPAWLPEPVSGRPVPAAARRPALALTCSIGNPVFLLPPRGTASRGGAAQGPRRGPGAGKDCGRLSANPTSQPGKLRSPFDQNRTHSFPRRGRGNAGVCPTLPIEDGEGGAAAAGRAAVAPA